MRFGLELVDLTDTFKQSGFKVFQSTATSGGAVKAINAKGLADLTQGEIKALEEIAKSLGAKGLAYIKVEGGEWKSPIVKFFSETEKAELTAKLGIAEGDAVFFAAAPWEKACAILGRIRLEAAVLLQKRGKLTIRPDDWKFLWVIEFPLMTHDEAENRYVATHHPFTDLALAKSGDYFATELVEDEWDVGPVTFYRRPLSRIVQDVAQAGFRIEEIAEPRPEELLQEDRPAWYARARTRPQRLFIRCRKAG